MQGNDLLMATMTGGLVVLFGAVYALFFALGKLRHSHALLLLAYVSYLVLAGAAALLSISLSLSGGWLAVIAIALLGYLLLPQAIWHLCVATHAAVDTEKAPALPGATES